MELLFDDLIHTHQPACLAVARFSAPVLVTQLRVTSLDQQQQQQQPERPLQLLVHSMPSTSRPYAHFDSFTLSLAASSERTQVFDLPISPEHTTPARLMVFRGPWEGLQVQVYGFIQKKKRAAAAPASTSESAHSGNLKRVKLEDPSHVTPVASTSQDSQGEQQRPRRLQVPDWKGIQDLLQLHRQRRGASQRSQTAHRDVLDAAREAWREQSRDETALEHADMLALWRKTSDITIPASVQKALAQLAQATAKPTLDSQSDVDTVESFVLDADEPLKVRRGVHRQLLATVHACPSLGALIAQPVLRFEQDQHPALLAHISRRCSLQTSMDRTDIPALLSGLDEDPSYWPFALDQALFDVVQDAEPLDQAAFWSAVLHTPAALRAGVFHVLDNTSKEAGLLPARSSSPQLLDFLRCVALQTSGAFLDADGLDALQSQFVVAAVALEARQRQPTFFWAALQDESTRILLHLLNMDQNGPPLPALNPWTIDDRALETLSSAQSGAQLSIQTVSSVLGHLRMHSADDCEAEWSSLCSRAGPLFFTVLHLAGQWLQELESISHSCAMDDKDGFSLGGSSPTEHTLVDLLWIQLAALRALDTILPSKSVASSQEAVVHLFLHTFRLALALDSLSVATHASLLKAIASSVMGTLATQLDDQHVLFALRKMLQILRARCNATSTGPVLRVLDSLLDAPWVSQQLFALVPDLASLATDPLLHWASTTELGDSLQDHSPQLQQAVIDRVSWEIKALQLSTAQCEQDNLWTVVMPLAKGLRILGASDELLDQALLPFKQSKCYEQLRYGSYTSTFASDVSLRSLLDLVARPSTRMVPLGGDAELQPHQQQQPPTGFVIKRYEGPEGFRNRVHRNDANYRPPSLHVDDFQQQPNVSLA